MQRWLLHPVDRTPRALLAQRDRTGLRQLLASKREAGKAQWVRRVFKEAVRGRLETAAGWV